MQVSGLSQGYKQQFCNPCLAFSSAEPGPFPASCLHQPLLPYLVQGETPACTQELLCKKPYKKYRPLFHPEYCQPLHRKAFLICAQSPAVKQNILFGDSCRTGNALLGTGLQMFL